MAEEKAKKPTDKELKQDKNASVDFPVVVESLENDPYHENGERFLMGHKKAKQAESKKWVTIISKEPITDYKEIIKLSKSLAMILLLAACSLFSFGAQAQIGNFLSPYNVTKDTVTNTGTAYLTSPYVAPAAATSTTVWIAVTKISGTVGGTISLLGSLDGTNFKAMNTVDTQTALATITAADTSATYHYRLAGSPFLYYRVSWTGTGTMAASFTAKILRAK